MSQGPRLILAFVFSILIMFVYYTYIDPPVSRQQTSHAQQNKQEQDAAVAAPDKTTTGEMVASAQKKEPQTPPDQKDNNETTALTRDVPIETMAAHVVLTTRGGMLTSYELKNYRREANDNAPFTNLLGDTAGSRALFMGLKGYSRFDRDKVFDLIKDEILEDNTHRLHLLWQNSEIKIEKTITFGGLKTDYAAQVDYQITNLSDHDLSIAPYLESEIRQKPMPKKDGGVLSFLKLQQPNIFYSELYKDQKLIANMNWDDFKGNQTEFGNISWAAISERYFIVGMVLPTDSSQNVTVHFDRRDDFLIGQIRNQEITLSPGAKTTGEFIAYLGPKKLAELEAVGAFLEESVDYGWFSFLALPILWLMTFLHGFIPSWGVVIIALTFIIKILLHPINKKSMQSMKGMQQLQPKLKEIKEKFANDKEKQNKEVMQLFKTHKVNPMGGCLPLLLQMPIYIVLYKVLWNAIELYHAPFLGVYKDLSAPDPYFVAPILLGVFMFLQQKLTPAATVDPAQQKMMMFMPIMFTALMLFLPVGLVVYIFVNTVMSVIQQFMIKRDITFKQLMMGRWQAKGA
ncbi:MAG: membrane protein insertase YidC [Deltaproteobacteria bacterium]|nr:membrane protein insertase YidC [Deltaproteobacteria bacterium]